MDQVAGCGGHPHHRHRIAKNENRVGARALRAREPVGQQDEHRGKDEALCDAQQQPVQNQQPVVVNDPRESGKDSPADEREEDKPGGAFADGVGRRRNLKKKIAEKEDRAEKSRAGFGDVERFREARRCAESEIRPAQVRKAVGHEDYRHQVQPAPAQARLNFLGLGLRRFVRIVLGTSLYSIPVGGCVWFRSGRLNQ